MLAHWDTIKKATVVVVVTYPLVLSLALMQVRELCLIRLYLRGATISHIVRADAIVSSHSSALSSGVVARPALLQCGIGQRCCWPRQTRRTTCTAKSTESVWAASEHEVEAGCAVATAQAWQRLRGCRATAGIFSTREKIRKFDFDSMNVRMQKLRSTISDALRFLRPARVQWP